MAKRYKVGHIAPSRKDPDTFMVQCLEVAPLNLSSTRIPARLLKGMKKWKHATHWKKRHPVHKSELFNEEVLARTVRNKWGYGDFKICFFSRREPNVYKRKDKNGKIRPFTWGFKPRARVLIKAGYNPTTQEDYEYHFSEMLMHKMPFWEGKKSHINKEPENLTGSDYGGLMDKDEFTRI